MSSSSSPGARPEGPGSVSGAPNLPAGFAATFTSQFFDVGGVRLHAVIGGDGPPATGPRMAPDLVRLALGDADTGPGLPGRRSRPARHRAVG